mgnify:CR=1 FL=1
MNIMRGKNFVAGWVNIWLENCVIPAFLKE